MIIVSQDKKRRVNFDNTEGFFVENTEIKVATQRNNVQIGNYDTEERAIEVLKAITAMYQASELFKCVEIGFQEEILGEIEIKQLDQYPFVYEMPEK